MLDLQEELEQRYAGLTHLTTALSCTAQQNWSRYEASDLTFDDVKRIYELTYKLQQLTVEEERGWYGAPDWLEDSAANKKMSVEMQLNDALDAAYPSVVRTYDAWLEGHPPAGLAGHVSKEQISNTFNSRYTSIKYTEITDWLVYIKPSAQDLIVEFNKANIDMGKIIDAFAYLYLIDNPEVIQQINYLLANTKVVDLKYLINRYREAAEGLKHDFNRLQSLHNDVLYNLNEICGKLSDSTRNEFLDSPYNRGRFTGLTILSHYPSKLAEALSKEPISDEERSRLVDSMHETNVQTVNQYNEQTLDRHRETTAYGAIENMRQRLNGWPSDTDGKVIMFQEALTTAHNNGAMAIYLINDDNAVALLGQLSDGLGVEEWNADLSKVLHREPGSTTTPQPVQWFSTACRRLARIIQLLANDQCTRHLTAALRLLAKN